jgi:sulfate adenylyltransferase
LADEPERLSELRRAEGLTAVPMTSRESSDLVMMAMGAYTPLGGFMGHDDWRRVCLEMKLSDGLFWPIPITLSCGPDLADSIEVGEEVALNDQDSGQIMATMAVTEKYGIDRELECASVFRTTDPDHPGVEKVMTQGAVNLAGPVRAISEGVYPQDYEGLYLRPAETRALFEARGWSKVAAFQTRNPMHRSHEYLAKIAIEVCDGLLIHQVLGKLKPGDIPAEVRVRAIDALVENYFVAGTVFQAGYPIEMRYAGPREALLHALFRQNFGCSHLVVGRTSPSIATSAAPRRPTALVHTARTTGWRSPGRVCGPCSPTTNRYRRSSADPKYWKFCKRTTTALADPPAPPWGLTGCFRSHDYCPNQ